MPSLSKTRVAAGISDVHSLIVIVEIGLIWFCWRPLQPLSIIKLRYRESPAYDFNHRNEPYGMAAVASELGNLKATRRAISFAHRSRPQHGPSKSGPQPCRGRAVSPSARWVDENWIIDRGHTWVQAGSAIDHGDRNCLRSAGRLAARI